MDPTTVGTVKRNKVALYSTLIISSSIFQKLKENPRKLDKNVINPSKLKQLSPQIKKEVIFLSRL